MFFSVLLICAFRRVCVYKSIDTAVIVLVDLIARDTKGLDEEWLWLDVALEPAPVDRVGIRDFTVVTG
jgi:hypothetical protein